MCLIIFTVTPLELHVSKNKPIDTLYSTKSKECYTFFFCVIY